MCRFWRTERLHDSAACVNDLVPSRRLHLRAAGDQLDLRRVRVLRRVHEIERERLGHLGGNELPHVLLGALDGGTETLVARPLPVEVLDAVNSRSASSVNVNVLVV